MHGDLTDLVPTRPHPRRHPDDVDRLDQVESAAAATAELLLEVQRGRSEIARLEKVNAALARKRKRLKRRLKAAADD